MNESTSSIIQSVIEKGITLVSNERFDTVIRHYDKINKLDGDIVECGVYKGGFSIFLTTSFTDKTIWVCDSFEGFQPLKDAVYQYGAERHTPETTSHMVQGIDIVKENFKSFNLLTDRVKFLQGWVRNTLKPETCQIKQIALLRVDVDSYSATHEVLDYLYPKVVSGGYIIFDDSCLFETKNAIKNYFSSNKIPLVLKDPVSDGDVGIDSTLQCGCYYIKP